MQPVLVFGVFFFFKDALDESNDPNGRKALTLTGWLLITLSPFYSHDTSI